MIFKLENEVPFARISGCLPVVPSLAIAYSDSFVSRNEVPCHVPARSRGTIIVACKCNSKIFVAADRQETLTDLQGEILLKTYECQKVKITSGGQVIGGCGDGVLSDIVMARYSKEFKDQNVEEGVQCLKKLLQKEVDIMTDKYPADLSKTALLLAGFSQRGNAHIYGLRIISGEVTINDLEYAVLGSGRWYADIIMSKGKFGHMKEDEAWEQIKTAIAMAMKNDEICGGDIDTFVIESDHSIKQEMILHDGELKNMIAKAPFVMIPSQAKN